MASAPAPAATSTKYDRQIRIWGDHGQTALQNASLCLINATPTATELLKNLVLPGIGSFTLIDGHPITDHDRASNFFLSSPDAPSTSRAHAITSSLHQLNDSVRASYIPAHPHTFLHTPALAHSFVQHFSIVVVSQLSLTSPVARALSIACAHLNIPLLFVRAYGLAAYVRVQITEHFVLDARSPDRPPDLRLHNPFPQLLAAAHNVFSISDPSDSSHIPFVLILAHAVLKFKAAHQNRLPHTRDEKDRFRKLVQDSRPPACPVDAENFEQALKGAHLRLCHSSASSLPSEVSDVLNAATKMLFPTSVAPPYQATPRDATTAACNVVPQAIAIGAGGDSTVVSTQPSGATHIARQHARWWLCAAAVQDFLGDEGVLPLSGTIPDMVSDTKSYVLLHTMYAERAAEDARAVWKRVGKISQEHALDHDVELSTVSAFCRRVRETRVVRTRRVVDEMDGLANDASDRGEHSRSFAEAAEMEGALDSSAKLSTCATPYYVTLRAVDLFEGEHGRVPGSRAEERDADVGRMQELVEKVGKRLDVRVGGEGWRDVVEETVRYAGTETHCVAALVGGVAAQEVTKLVTRQFTPLDDTLVFNAAAMTSASFRA